MCSPVKDIRSEYKGAIISVCGPPHSGKSVFLAELYTQLLKLEPTRVFLQRACPDGEGMWSTESDPDVAARIRRKGQFSPEFITHTLESIKNLGRYFPLVLLDLGGKRSPENAEIMRHSTHALILSSLPEEITLWQEFAIREGNQILGVFHSRQLILPDGSPDLSGQSELDLSGFPSKGTLMNLTRSGPREPYSEAVTQLAAKLVEIHIYRRT